MTLDDFVKGAFTVLIVSQIALIVAVGIKGMLGR